MADYQHNQWAAQALALHQQADSEHRLQQVSEQQAPQVALAEAALEAHLNRQQQYRPLVVLQMRR